MFTTDKKLKQKIEVLEDALDHIMRVSSEGKTQSRRDRWIHQRAKSALSGDDEWLNTKYPKKAKFSSREFTQQKIIDFLKEKTGISDDELLKELGINQH